jgi:hypothetical protein
MASSLPAQLLLATENVRALAKGISPQNLKGTPRIKEGHLKAFYAESGFIAASPRLALAKFDYRKFFEMVAAFAVSLSSRFSLFALPALNMSVGSP